MSWSEAALMLTSGLLVAAAAVPLGLLARALRPRSEPLLPEWKPWPVPWTGFEVTLAFLAGAFVMPSLVAALLAALRLPDAPGDELTPTLRALWASLLALPLTLLALWLAARNLYPRRPSLAGRGSVANGMWLAVLAWLALAPAVLLLHAGVNAVALQFDVPPEQHPLTKLGGRSALDGGLLVVQACVCAPLWEELFFRGILLSWCAGRTKVPGLGVSPATALRPWFVMAAAAVFAALAGNGRSGPLVFAAVLAVGLAVLWRSKRTGARRARAVYATAALFALGHPTWPTPIPLFALGLGLGYLAVRTNGVLVPAIVHGLFNAVSVAFVLRS